MRLQVTGSAAVAFLLTVALSGSVPGPGGARVPEPPTDPGTLVLQVQEWFSMTPPYERAALPEVTVYGGGRVIVPASRAGSVEQALEFRLAPDRYRHIYRLAHRAGLARSAHLAEPEPSTDGSLLIASLRSAGRVHTTTLVSPGRSEETGARSRIIDFRRYLRVLAVPADGTRPAAYHPVALAALTTGGWQPPVAGAPDAPRPWPGGDLAGGAPTRMGRCTILTGTALAAAEALGRPVAAGTLWQSGGHSMTVALRPLLPDEHSCADVDRHLG